jgi:pectate lyase
MDAGRADGSAGSSGRDAGAGGTSTGGDGATSCTTPSAGALLGWASVDGMGFTGGTTGGGTATPVTVSTAAEFTANIGGTAARVIYLNGSISGSFGIGSNKTVVGLCGARVQGHIGISNASNVIVRNLAIVGNNCTDSPDDCSAGADAVTIGNGSHHIWFDHDDVSDGSDGNLDITSGSDFVTISWTKFHYSTARSNPTNGANGHRFSNLIGSADTVTTDAGHLNVTWHHDWWADNVAERMPRTRFGQIHVFNNLYTAAGNAYCTNAGIQTHVLVENNVYMGVNNPLSPDANGDMLARGNVFTNTTGTRTATGTGFTPPYAYMLDDTAALAAVIMSGAGPH